MEQKGICVFLPTYNEAENIAGLIGALFALGLPGLRVLVVDDDSPDGTGRIVEGLLGRHPGLRLLRRSGPAGRGRAGRDGYLAALESGAERVIEMDADGSHLPEHVPQLLSAMDSCDVAVGSRFTQGGSDMDRPPARRWLTRVANAYARRMLRLPIEDTNSGFRCFSRAALERIRPAELRSRGPSIIHETLYRAARAGLRIREVPIRFVDRREGTSKLNLFRLAAGYLWILKLRLGPG